MNLKALVAVCAVAALSALGAAQGDLTGLDVRQADKGVEIEVKGTNLSQPKELRAWGGESYLVEFEGNLAIKPIVNKAVNKAGVKWVSCQWFSAKPPRVRVHVKLLDPTINPTLTKTDGGWLITIGEKVAPKTAPKNSDGKTKEDESAMSQAIQDLQNGGLPAVPKPGPTNTTGGGGVTGGTPQNHQALVDVDFVNTDVLQILKALSIQSGMNIIASPSVSPSGEPVKVTASLSRVTLDDALSLITAMANLRYAKIGNTYVVTPAGDFVRMMRQVMQSGSARYDTRVVNLTSGEAAQIRDATLTAYPQDGRLGFYDIIIPTQPGATPPPQVTLADLFNMSQSNQNNQQGGTTGTNGQGGTNPPATKPQEPVIPAKAYYLMVVGEPARVTEVADYIQQLDARIARSYSVNRSEDIGSVVIPLCSGQTDRIAEMIEKMIAKNPRANEFSISKTSLKDSAQTETGTQVLLMMGPKEDLDSIKSMAMSIDEDLCEAQGIAYDMTANGQERTDQVIDLDFVDPTSAMNMLKGRIPGLFVTLVPDPVSPRGGGSSSSTSTGGGGGGGTEGGGTGGGTGVEIQGAGQGSGGSSDEEDITPMKLWVRGTRSQVEEAMHVVAMMDVAPKQVAFELRVLEMTKEDALKLGIDWSILSSGRTDSLRSNQSAGATNATPGTVSLNYIFKGISSLNLLAQLDKSDNNLHFIARPNSLTTDGRMAKIFVGDTVRYIQSIQSTQNGVTVQIGEVKVGVDLNVVPRIGSNGNMAMDIQANQSILQSFTPVPGGGDIPQTSDRQVKLFANMRSGETLVLGGLIQEADRNRVSGIPLLKDLPIIGQLFRRTERVKQRTEVVFFLTAVEVGEGTREGAASPRGSEQKLPDPLGEYNKGRKANGG
jgi:type II secretory pathway component GspD/PulD (secretin)